MSLTKQEMFDRAYRGLASQGWRRSTGSSGCVYLTADGRRCAWGWVDTSLESDAYGSVGRLRRHGIGIAASLDDSMLEFAERLQIRHDNADDDHLRMRLEEFAAEHSLSIPELP